MWSNVTSANGGGLETSRDPKQGKTGATQEEAPTGLQGSEGCYREEGLWGDAGSHQSEEWTVEPLLTRAGC